MKCTRFEELPVWKASIELAVETYALTAKPAFRGLESGILNLESRAESVSKQLGAWIRSIHDSEKKGQRFVTEQVRRAEEAAREPKAFLEELRGHYRPPV